MVTTTFWQTQFGTILLQKRIAVLALPAVVVGHDLTSAWLGL